MGGNFSCKGSSVSEFNSIRIIHFNGFVEDLEQPLTAGQVIGKPPNHFLFTYVQLLSGSVPLKPDTLLEPGKIYFLLPYSLFHSSVSPADLAPIVRKLAAITNKCQRSKTSSASQSFPSSRRSTSAVWSPPASSPNRFSDQTTRVDPKNDQTICAMMHKSQARSWKPILATIREISFNRRSESDLQEN